MECRQCVRACVCACVRACVRACTCVRACVRAGGCVGVNGSMFVQFACITYCYMYTIDMWCTLFILQLCSMYNTFASLRVHVHCICITEVVWTTHSVSTSKMICAQRSSVLDDCATVTVIAASMKPSHVFGSNICCMSETTNAVVCV